MGIGERVRGVLRRVDAIQRDRPVLGLPVAVIKRFSEDRAGQLAALIAYYGFFSLFPLLLALVTFAALVFGESQTAQRIFDTAIQQFPVVGQRIAGETNLQQLPGKGIGLAVGLVTALWAGLGGLKAAQNAMDTVWDVPIKRQPSFLVAILRALLMLVALGGFLLIASFLGGIAAGASDLTSWPRFAAIVGTMVLDIALFLVAFRVLTVARVTWRDVAPGAVFTGLAWVGLQTVGGYLIGHRIQTLQSYGFFAVVIGLLTWMFIAAQVVLLATELNVVLARRLWPRSISDLGRTPADYRALRRHADVEERVEDEAVDVRFGRPHAPSR